MDPINISVIVQSSVGEEHHKYSLPPSASIGELKDRLYNDLGIETSRQRLIFKGRIMELGSTLQQCGKSFLLVLLPK